MMKKVNLKYNEDIINDFVNELKKNPFLKKYNITEDNANIFYTLNNDHSNCMKCNGLESCKNETSGFYTDVILENDTYKAKMRMCRYKELKQAQNNKSSLIKTLFMPESVLNANINDFKTSNEERKKILSYSTKFITTYNKNNFLKGLLLYGPYSTGKTYLLASVANELASRNIKSLMMYFPDLVRELKNSIGTPRFDELINMLKSIDVLMIDDLGSEMMTTWLRDEVIGPIINYRVSEQLPIFISTNLTLEQLTEHFAQTKDGGIDNTKAGRIMDRIKSLVTVADIGNEMYSR